MGSPGEAEPQEVRGVLDTNTVISALVFPHGRLSWMRPLWTTGQIVPLICRESAAELIETLAYPKFKLDEIGIRTLLAAYLPFVETVDAHVDAPAMRGLRCRDPDDQVFLTLASIGGAMVLVTGDPDLLVLKNEAPFAIETPAAFKKRFPDAFESPPRAR